MPVWMSVGGRPERSAKSGETPGSSSARPPAYNSPVDESFDASIIGSTSAKVRAVSPDPDRSVHGESR